MQRLDRVEERREPRGIVEVRALVAELAVDLRQRRAAEPVPARAEIDPHQRRLARVRCAAAASASAAHPATGAKAETISDSGAVTAFSPSPSCHVVRIDIESLPTGMLMPSAGHSSIATARTVSKSAASSPGCPAGAIQFADSLMSESFAMPAAAMLVIASPTAMRPDAGASISASGVRSPIAIASPA